MTTKLDTTGQRWIAVLPNYNFDISYSNGKKNDGLSQWMKGKWAACHFHWSDDIIAKLENIEFTVPM